MSEQTKLERLSAARLEAGKASSARERLVKLFDENTFAELDALVKCGGAGCGVITGYGEIDGATVFAFSQDVSARGAAVGSSQAKKIVKLYEMAVKTGAPVVGVYDSKGADIAEGNGMLAAYREILSAANNLSGVVPQVSLVLGVCGGLSAMAACAADFVIMSEKAELFLTPPAVAKDGAVAGTAEAAQKSGTAQIVTSDEDEAIAKARQLLSMLPANNLSAAATFDFSEPQTASLLDTIESTLGETTKCDLVRAIVDEGSFLLIGSGFGQGAHTALCTLSGFTVGMVTAGGVLDHDGAARIARFVSVCDSFQIPVVTMINTEGFAPAGAEELAGSIRDIARLSHVYAEATTPKVALITGSAVGSAYVALSQADLTLAWPNASISALPVSAAVAFLKGGEITAQKSREQVEAEYKDNEASALRAAEEGFVSDIIDPKDTREELIEALDMLSGKRVSRLPKKHSNLPM